MLEMSAQDFEYMAWPGMQLLGFLRSVSVPGICTEDSGRRVHLLQLSVGSLGPCNHYGLSLARRGGGGSKPSWRRQLYQAFSIHRRMHQQLLQKPLSSAQDPLSWKPGTILGSLFSKLFPHHSARLLKLLFQECPPLGNWTLRPLTFKEMFLTFSAVP